MTVESVLAQQVLLYGEPLAQRFARVLSAYQIPQSRLAAAIGLSAPMLSQLASGQRVKISNPAVYARLLRLEQMASSPAVLSGDAEQVQAALDEVSASHPTLTTERGTPGDFARTSAMPADIDPAMITIEHLAGIASGSDLSTAAAAVPAGALANVLHAAASRRGARP